MITIRQAAAGDIGAVMALETECYDEYTREDRAVYAGRIAAFPEGFLILEDGEGAAGAICGEIWDGDSPLTADRFTLGHPIHGSLDRKGSRLYVASLAVAASRRGRGYGGLLFACLVRRICAAFPAVTEGVLLVNEDWNGARRLYEKNGFAESGRLPRFFRAGSGAPRDGIIMTAPLNSALK